jgi:putative transposase
MATRTRQLSATGMYHVMLRGVNQQQILEDKEDNEKFLWILRDCKLICGYELYAYCLMGNHVHLVIKVGKEPLDLVLRRICAKYVYWYNSKYYRVGHLFQNRFKSEPVEDDVYFLRVLRYIHMNPVKAGLAKKPGDYPFSSYNCYIQGQAQSDSLVDIAYAFNIISMEQLKKFHNDTSKDEDEDDFLDIGKRRLRLTDEKARGIIMEISKCQNASEFQLLGVNERNSCVRRLKKEGLSIRQISRLTGVNRGVVEKLVKDDVMNEI